MKIKHLSIFAAAAMMFGFSSCTNEDPQNEAPVNGENVYARIQLYMPSRSETDIDDPDKWNGTDNSSDGYEIGLEHENRVNDVIVVLATKDDATGEYTSVAVGKSSAMPVSPVEDDRFPIFTLTFQKDEIQQCADQRVYIFAYCNASKYINENDLFDVDRVLSITNPQVNQGIWANGSILMANAPNTIIPSKLLPNSTALKKDYQTPEKALDLGTVDVARVVSRFDFKSINNNEYPINQYTADPNDPDKLLEEQIATVKLISMAPLNIAKEFYVFPRVSNDGTDANWTLCGTEYFAPLTNVNYVVSPNWADKNANALPSSLLSKYFNQSTGMTDYSDLSDITYTELKDLVNDDNDEQWYDTEEKDKSGYKIWRYVTENTLPRISSQKKGITTGIIFKAEITNPKSGTLLAEAMALGKNIYSFNGVIYGDLKTLRATVYSLDINNALRQAFVAVFGESYLDATKDESGNIIFTVKDEDLKDCTNIANTSDASKKERYFKIYTCTKEADGDHYYVYYTYYNRHNDNKNSVEMGAMEFGTVRNNIYKLYVSSISEFGYTRPEELPDDPDEESKTYLKVSCRVVPWIVRVNKIEF